MQIDYLELQNFRNIKELSQRFSPGCNIIFGENGQGKTNILESIFMCSFGRSHKNSREKEIINNTAEEAHIKAEFVSQINSHRVDIHLKKGKSKGMALDRIPIKRFSELYGNIPVVMFSSEDLDIIRRGPSDRRRFIDMELCQTDPLYLDSLVNYNKILVQRRELFKAIGEGEDIHGLAETLDIWDLQLCEYGTAIIKRRRKFIDELNDIIFDIHYDLTGGREKLKIEYSPSVEEGMLFEALLKNRERDKIYRQTHQGPHRDDIEFFDSGTDLKIYGSNGQQRSCAISLKLSEISLIERKKHEKPVLLLDDVLSELDRSRQIKLIRNLHDIQTVITCTGLDELIEKNLTDIHRIHVSEGKAESV